MAPSKQETYRQVLLELQAELAATNTGNSGTETVELDQSKVGRLSRMDALQSQQMALEAKRRKELKRRAIEGALRRIEAGDFGYCFVCGTTIAEARLNVDPTLTRCRDCVETDPE